MQDGINKETLLNTLSAWNSYLHKKVYLIACGGTALTLVNVKASTKDIDFMIPDEREYKYLTGILEDLGYKNKTGYGWTKDEGFKFDLFLGNKIFTTELLESPLEKNNNIKLREFTHIYVGVLNYYDLIISKVFRYSPVDIKDCLALFKAKHGEIDIEKLKNRFYETSSYDTSDEKNKKHFQHFLSILKKEGFNI